MLPNLGNSQREGGLGVVVQSNCLDYAFRILQGLPVCLFRCDTSPRFPSF